jgi:4-carboxymuconolactone decarboxylase
MPSDIDPSSGFRLPIPPREALDEARQKIFDVASSGAQGNLAGLQGPAGIQLHTRAGPLLHALNRYVRFESGIPARVREVAILITAREMDSQFEWVAHEPEALKLGVPQATVDVIKFRGPLDGVEPDDALVIELGRQVWREHKVSAATFARAKDRFGASMLVDLVVLMGNYASTAALLSAVDMQLHRGKTPLLPIP